MSQQNILIMHLNIALADNCKLYANTFILFYFSSFSTIVKLIGITAM